MRRILIVVCIDRRLDRLHGGAELQASGRARAAAVPGRRTPARTSLARRREVVRPVPGRDASRPDQGSAARRTTTSASPRSGCCRRKANWPRRGPDSSRNWTRREALPARASSRPSSRRRGAFGVASWEIDLFGKLRRATEAARADLLALQENQKAVMQILVAQVASAYFDLREYDAELEYVRESIKTRQESVKLVTAREEGGVASMLDLDQAKTLVASAQAELALLEKAQEQTENLINFLLGKQPGPVARGRSLDEQPQPPQVPAGLPSALLERRPDLRAAEQQLIAANARVGVAKAAFYPSINLTAAGGYQTTDLLGVVSRTGFAYSMGGVVDLPIFDAGRRQGNYKTAKAQHEELLINYQKAINGAFRDVSDALVGYQKTKEYTSSQNAPRRDAARPKPCSPTCATSAASAAIWKCSTPSASG